MAGNGTKEQSAESSNVKTLIRWVDKYFLEFGEFRNQEKWNLFLDWMLEQQYVNWRCHPHDCRTRWLETRSTSQVLSIYLMARRVLDLEPDEKLEELIEAILPELHEVEKS